jgi:hypothetical protein
VPRLARSEGPSVAYKTSTERASEEKKREKEKEKKRAPCVPFVSQAVLSCAALSRCCPGVALRERLASRLRSSALRSRVSLEGGSGSMLGGDAGPVLHAREVTWTRRRTGARRSLRVSRSAAGRRKGSTRGAGEEKERKQANYRVWGAPARMRAEECAP